MNKKNSPLITIFTLSLNSPDLFGAIDSVLMQDYDNIEYIILDDCSEHFDVDEIKKYVSSKQKGNIISLVVEKNSERLGIVKQTNKALTYSTGKYIFNLAGDDQFYDDKVISDWVKEFEETGAEIITAYREVYDEHLSVPIRIMPEPNDVEAIKTLSPKQLFEYMEAHNIIFGSSTARSRKNVDRLGLVDEKYMLIEDYIVALRQLRTNKPINFFDRKVIKYRDGGVCAVDKVDKEYLKDNDKIIKYELLPYSENKKAAKKKYLNWRKGTILAQYRNRSKMKHNPIYSFFIYSLFVLRYPLFTLRKMIEKSRKRNRS